MQRLFGVTAVFLLTACASPSSESGSVAHSEQSLHAQFLEARQRVSQPYILLGHDTEERYDTFGQQIRRLGDVRFAAALSREPPDVIAAVGHFIQYELVCPRTRALIRSVPDVSFIAVRMTEEDAKHP